MSPSIYRLRGFTAEEAMKQNITEILTPESIKIASDELTRELHIENLGTADPDRSVILELEEYKKDGTIIWVENRVSFIRDKNNRAIGILIVSRDITDRKKARENLRKAKHQAKNPDSIKCHTRHD